MESGEEGEEGISDDEKVPELTVVRVVNIAARDEADWDDYFDEYHAGVNGYVYKPRVWRNAVARISERNIHRRWKVRVDEAKAREEERERMERNEVTKFYFLVEEGRRAEAERVERRVNAETRRGLAALEEAESRGRGEIIRTTVQVRILTGRTISRILSEDEKVRYITVDGSDEDEVRIASFKTDTEEDSLRARMKLKEEQVAVLLRHRLWGRGFPLRDDSVTLIVPLENEVKMTEDGRAMLKQHWHNQVFIEYPQRLDILAMGEDKPKVLREISAAADLRNMEATQMEDVVTVTARFFHDDQGEPVGNISNALSEIVDLCHGARANDHNATETRRRAIESQANLSSAPAESDNRGRPTGVQDVVDSAVSESASGEEEEGESAGRANTEGKRTQEELLKSYQPMLIPLAEGDAWRVNQQFVDSLSKTLDEEESQESDAEEEVEGEVKEVEVTMVGSMWPGGPMLVLPSGESGPQQLEMLRQEGFSWEEMENDTEALQNSTTNRKTCDGGDPQDKDHTSESGRGEK